MQIGNGEADFAQPWVEQYTYDNGETPITFTLMPPAEGFGCTPIVNVVDPGFENYATPDLQERGGKYSFTITPNALWFALLFVLPMQAHLEQLFTAKEKTC